MIRSWIGACAVVLTLQSQALAEDFLIDLIIWKLEVKDGPALTSYKQVKDKGKVVYSAAITAQGNNPFEFAVDQGDLKFHVDGVISKKDTDKKPSIDFKKISYDKSDDKTKTKVVWTLSASCDLQAEGQVLALWQTPQETLVITISYKK